MSVKFKEITQWNIFLHSNVHGNDCFQSENGHKYGSHSTVVNDGLLKKAVKGLYHGGYRDFSSKFTKFSL